MATCFVIQPFDNDLFDRRYRDVFKPAVITAGLEPYRVDEDPSASIPIDQIERSIRQATVCFAEITTNNPNVWFELGYAIARGKQVVLVCAEERDSQFPFDVQHRKIIRYKTGSPGDFAELEALITQHLQAAQEKEENLEDFSESTPVAQTEGLSDSELVTLATLAQTVDTPEEFVSSSYIKRDMERVGYTPLAVTLALRSLQKKGLTLSGTDQDFNGNEFFAHSVTDRGFDWLGSHQHLLVLKRTKGSGGSASSFPPDDDLPF